MKKIWQLQDAKTHFSKVVEKAQKSPQQISKRGDVVAVIISIETYQSLVQPKLSFVKFMQQSPLAGVDLGLKRNVSHTRDVDL